MGKKVLVVLVVVMFALSMAFMAFAADVKGKISKVAENKRSVTVQGRDGKETTYKFSKTTTYENMASRDELAEGMSVTINTEDGETVISITKR